MKVASGSASVIAFKVPCMIVPSGVRVPPPRPQIPIRSRFSPSSSSRSAITRP